MWYRAMLVFCGIAALASGVIIDRVAVIVGNAIIKDSDVGRDIRVTDFLNARPLDVSNSSRKKAADRLINQALIRREIRIGDYPIATLQQADVELNRLEGRRFKSPAGFQQALRRYGITELELRTEFQWQLTVLQFIDTRFKPAVLVSDQEIETYYRQHGDALRREYPGKASLDDLREDIQNIITGEKVNKLFFAWLDDQRKQTKIRFLEESLA
jgi:hypothetical protein